MNARRAPHALQAAGAAIADSARLAKPYFSSEEGPAAWRLLIAIVALNLFIVYLNVVYTYWYKVAYDALQTKTAPAFWASMFTYRVVHGFPYLVPGFAEIAAFSILAGVYAFYLTQMLEIRWRRWLTLKFIHDWFDRRTYYHLSLNATTSNGAPDNPDQRIADDLPSYVTSTLTLGMSLLSNAVTLVSFIGVLWAIAPPLTIGHTTIPGYLVWAALVYSIAGTWLTQVIGRVLIPLNFRQQQVNADFRFSLVRVRENTEQIALSAGESREAAGLLRRFEAIYQNWWSVMRRTKSLNFFTIGFTQIAIIFPLLVAAPGYFTGIFTLGVLLQIVTIFGNVQGAFSWFVSSYPDVVAWRATVQRLDGFARAMHLARSSADVPELSSMRSGNAFRAVDLEVDLPDGRALMRLPQFDLERGRPLVLTGPSGVGKSTLFRVLAEIWPFARGRLTVPTGKIVFLPQRPYMPLGTLRQAVTYPQPDNRVDDDFVRETLERVGLAGLVPQLDVVNNWTQLLSGGELQRVALARALVNKPDWLFMDEALSALDEEAGTALLHLVQHRLPSTQIVLITHSQIIADAFPRHARVERDGSGTADIIAAEAFAHGI